MKRLFIIAAFALMCFASVKASTFDVIFDEYRKIDNAEYVKIPKFLMMLAGKDAEIPKDLPFKGKVSGMKVLNITDTRNGTGERLEKSVKELADKNELEEVLRHNSDGEECRIWFSVSKDKIKEIYLLCSEPDEVSLIEFTGTFHMEN